MTIRLSKILLVDDNEADNFLHTRTIKRLDCADEVVVCENGQEAIDYLNSRIDGKPPAPDLVLLDLNMPVMDGFEFLEAYRELEVASQARVLIVALTTSLNPDDQDRINASGLATDFLRKPLTEERLRALVEQHFGSEG